METQNNSFAYCVSTEVWHFLWAKLEQNKINRILDSLPEGNKNPVFMIPGLASDRSTLTWLSEILRRKNFIVGSPDIGPNWGTKKFEEKLVRNFGEFLDKHGSASLVGHSLGGAAAVALARYNKEVKMVVTLAGAHGASDIQETLRTAFQLIAGKTDKEAWEDAMSRRIHTIKRKNSPVFNLIATEDPFLGPSVTTMHGINPKHVFKINTSHSAILQSHKTAEILIRLLAMEF
ncbi:MAG: hypothetical protein OEX08_02000 [Candidatus Nomurabacteria bacterium]|nr:hypothetical protein [Candidatus Nomurabacteria bacterium]